MNALTQRRRNAGFIFRNGWLRQDDADRNLRRVISELGLSDQLLTFWDNVVVLSRYREEFVHTVYGSERGVGSPEHPVKRRDKNVRAWYLTLTRHLLYLIDAVHLDFVVARATALGMRCRYL